MSEDRLGTWRPFVARLRARGWSDERIFERLQASGWGQADIEVLLGIVPPPQPAPEPVCAPQSVPCAQRPVAMGPSPPLVLTLAMGLLSLVAGSVVAVAGSLAVLNLVVLGVTVCSSKPPGNEWEHMGFAMVFSGAAVGLACLIPSFGLLVASLFVLRGLRWARVTMAVAMGAAVVLVLLVQLTGPSHWTLWGLAAIAAAYTTILLLPSARAYCSR